jgi:hypothetical protein
VPCPFYILVLKFSILFLEFSQLFEGGKRKEKNTCHYHSIMCQGSVCKIVRRKRKIKVFRVHQKIRKTLFIISDHFITFEKMYLNFKNINLGYLSFCFSFSFFNFNISLEFFVKSCQNSQNTHVFIFF